jgi:homoserine kinase
VTSRTAFAPATVANVAVGFDVLGFAVGGPGDRVTVTVEPGRHGVRLESIRGVVTDLPDDPRRNTATVALLSILERRPLPFGLRVALDKGIPLGSGMGGSAASAVAAVVAAAGLFDPPLTAEERLVHAVAGEAAASGAAHADNAAPCLWGGLTAVVGGDPPRVASIPVPPGVVCVLVHPRITIETRQARRVLPSQIALSAHVAQSMRLAGFLAGCFQGDLALVRHSMVDLLVEPVRSALIPGFAAARAAALAAGALGFGIAGSGPSVFAWTAGSEVAGGVEAGVRAAFAAAGLESDAWVGPLRRSGACLEPPVT